MREEDDKLCKFVGYALNHDDGKCFSLFVVKCSKLSEWGSSWANPGFALAWVALDIVNRVFGVGFYLTNKGSH